MKRRSNSTDKLKEMRDSIIGLGKKSIRKSYYPVLREQLLELDHFRLLLDQTYDAIFLFEIPSGKIIDVNKSACTLLNFSKEELVTLLIYDINPQLNQEEIDDPAYLKTIQVSDPKKTIITNFKTSFGKHIAVEMSISFAKIDQKAYGVIVAREISERLEAQKELIESKEKYRQLVEYANDAIFIIQNGIIKFSNKRTIDLLGYSSDELSNINFINLIHPSDKSFMNEWFEKKSKGEVERSTITFKALTKCREELWMDLSSVAINWEGEPAILNFLRDITEKKMLESQFLQAQKMESIGTLAGGIAHDFNNLLMGMLGNLSIALIDMDPFHPIHSQLKNIESFIKKATGLTNQLLGFARGGKYEVKSTYINDLVKKSALLFGRTKKEIIIHLELEKNIWVVEVDRGQMEQVLLNLYVNSWQAMPNGGDIYIKTENMLFTERDLKPFYVLNGRFVKISVRDNGLGMDEKTIQRIFDPFFTTKEISRGTGLSLPSVYGIIKNHGGFITVTSKVNSGSTFDIFIPASDKKVIEEHKFNSELIKGDKTILIVDDEKMVLEITPKMLTKIGYKALTAQNGKEAIDIYEKNINNIDMVILDIIMPEMSGTEVYKHLKKINPDIKVLLCSGYSLESKAAQLLKEGCKGFIQKPFNIREISHKLKEVLN